MDCISVISRDTKGLQSENYEGSKAGSLRVSRTVRSKANSNITDINHPGSL
jgi:hypothetical protein